MNKKFWLRWAALGIAVGLFGILAPIERANGATFLYTLGILALIATPITHTTANEKD